MNPAEQFDSAVLILTRPLRIVLTDDRRAVAQDIGNVLDRATVDENLSRKRVAKAVRVSALDSAFT
jgi:hypothetical protein